MIGGTGWQRMGQTVNQGLASRFILPGWQATWPLAVMSLAVYIGWILHFHAHPPWLRRANKVLYGPAPFFSSGLAQAALAAGAAAGYPAAAAALQSAVAHQPQPHLQPPPTKWTAAVAFLPAAAAIVGQH